MTEEIHSFKELQNQLAAEGNRSYLLLYKKDSEKSECAFKNIAQVDTTDLKLLTADVSQVKDIHPQYQIKTVPTLIEFEGTEVRNMYKGCQAPETYKAQFEHAVYAAKMEKEGKKIHHVTVYSTPTCPWCTTLKNYLKEHNIRFRDIDVSRDQKAAEEMVARSGQQGVPQTNIDGEMIIGFDQNKINRLLEI